MAFKYEQDSLGIIHQIPPTVTEHPDYRKKYNQLGNLSIAMGYLRLGVLLNRYRGPRTHLLDIGPGNGDFLSAASSMFRNVNGYDKGDNKARLNLRYDVVTMFDSLEHIEDLSFVDSLNTSFILISVPWCHWKPDTQEFYNWRHLRPGEHLHHFNGRSLGKLFEKHFDIEYLSNVEDAIRRNENQKEPNILTMGFKRRN